MRTSALRDFFAKSGASFSVRNGVEIVTAVTDHRREYELVRDAVALCDASHMQVFRIPETAAADVLDPILAGNVARVRFGRILHTFLADENGMLEADCYVANNDEEMFLLCESAVDDSTVRGLFMNHGGRDAGMEDLSDTHAVLALDGYRAPSVIKEVFGADVLGLPYLSVESCSFGGESVRLFRAGKTSEFGYLVLVSNAKASELAAVLLTAVEKQGGGLCGTAVHQDLRLEGRFFNIHAEGVTVRDPLALGLQWMMDFEKTAFRGSESIQGGRKDLQRLKTVGLRAAPGQTLTVGDRLIDDGAEVGRVVAACTSYVLGCQLGIGLVPAESAYAGLIFRLQTATGQEIRTISMPAFMPKSLTVKLDEM